MQNLEINQIRKWFDYDENFTVIKKENYKFNKQWWVIQHLNDGRKQTQDEETILSKSKLIRR